MPRSPLVIIICSQAEADLLISYRTKHRTLLPLLSGAQSYANAARRWPRLDSRCAKPGVLPLSRESGTAVATPGVDAEAKNNQRQSRQ